MSNYTRGRTLEYAVMNLFRQDEWVVTRAAGSHGPFDFIATKHGTRNKDEVWFLVLGQCKRVRGRRKEGVCKTGRKKGDTGGRSGGRDYV